MSRVTVIRDLGDYYRLINETPLSEARLDAAAEYVRQEGDAAWVVIEPLAGIWWNRVQRAVKERLKVKP